MASTSTIEAQIIGTSSVLRDAVRRLATVARIHRLPVLIQGETGTGKELAAQLVHQHSRRPGRFVAINCSAIPTDLLESELFSYARGAFSGASREHVGLFEQAHGGTLFLDEIGELPLALQPKLLRAIQDGEIRRLGSGDPRTVDVRVVAATHRHLGEMVAARWPFVTACGCSFDSSGRPGTRWGRWADLRRHSARYSRVVARVDRCGLPERLSP